MDVGSESRGAGGLEGLDQTAEFQTILAVAEALRAEFGVSIDAHPGGDGCEAGMVNRAFRATVRVILGGIFPSGDDPTAVVTWALRQAALRWLVELGVEDGVVDGVLGMEPGLGDRWLAYLALAPATVINDLPAADPNRPDTKPPSSPH